MWGSAILNYFIMVNFLKNDMHSFNLHIHYIYYICSLEILPVLYEKYRNCISLITNEMEVFIFILVICTFGHIYQFYFFYEFILFAHFNWCADHTLVMDINDYAIFDVS